MIEPRDSVGTRVELDDVGATLLGIWVEICVALTSVNGGAVSFGWLTKTFEEIVAIHDGKWERLTRTGNVFEASFRPGPGNILITGRPKSSGRPTSLFEYTVE